MKNIHISLFCLKDSCGENQELIHFCDFYNPKDSEETYSGRIKMMERNILMRYKNFLGKKELNELLDKLRLQYLKQEFIKLVIGPMDCNLGNTALLLTNNPNQNMPQIDLSPAYDLDISFNVSLELVEKGQMEVLRTLDGKTASINSFIQEFKDISGFRDFLQEFYEKIQNKSVAKTIVDNAYEKTNFHFFEENSLKYIEFLNERFKQVREACKNLIPENKGVDQSETVLE